MSKIKDNRADDTVTDRADLLSAATDSVSVRPLRCAVRNLAEFVHRRNGLGTYSSDPISGEEGIRLHKSFYRRLAKRFPDNEAKTEVNLKAVWHPGWDSKATVSFPGLEISGRADVILYPRFPSALPIAIEVKSLHDTDIEPPPESSQWAQAMIYLWLLLETEPPPVLTPQSELTCLLAFVNRRTRNVTIHRASFTYAKLNQWMDQTCRTWIRHITRLSSHLELRDASIASLNFPYENIRPGQRDFMHLVMRSILRKTPLFIEAPTGIGKTVSAIYPGLRALCEGLISGCIYATAKTSTRYVAAETLRLLRTQGLILRSVILTAKEKICSYPQHYCDYNECPAALHYYDNLPAAREEILREYDIEYENIRGIAAKYNICPFELALEAAKYSDFIICDYNHVFDPRVRLRHIIEPETDNSSLILIDEAHNLGSRAREMFSAVLRQEAVRAAIDLVGSVSPLSRLLSGLQRLEDYINDFKHRLYCVEPIDNLPLSLNELEPDFASGLVFAESGYTAFTTAPVELGKIITDLLFDLRRAIDDLSGEPQSKLRDFFFDLLWFSTALNELFDEKYVTALVPDSYKFASFENRYGPEDIQRLPVEIHLQCMDVSASLTRVFGKRHIPVFFSATLTPIQWFESMYYSADQPRALKANLPSPFEPDHLLLLEFSGLDLSWKFRSKNAPYLAGLIEAVIATDPGNVMVFFPSFAYMNEVRPHLAFLLSKYSAYTQLWQERDMNESQRRDFLVAFESEKTNVVACAVLGGIFSESIDLTGSRLKGVIVIGTGLPQPTPERQLERVWWQRFYHNGYEFAFVYPGFIKVLQAAGRVIRGENDHGFVILVDERFTTQNYRELYPKHWYPKQVANIDEMVDALGNFIGRERYNDS